MLSSYQQTAAGTVICAGAARLTISHEAPSAAKLQQVIHRRQPVLGCRRKIIAMGAV